MTKRRPHRTRELHPKDAKTPLRLQNPDALDDTQFRWRAGERFIDYDDADWGWGQVTIREFFQTVLPRLQEYETMTWNELFRRDSCHSWDIDKMPTKARNKLKRRYPEYDTFHQVDLQQPCRLFGWRDRQFLYLIWYDPKHTICPR